MDQLPTRAEMIDRLRASRADVARGVLSQAAWDRTRDLAAAVYDMPIDLRKK